MRRTQPTILLLTAVTLVSACTTSRGVDYTDSMQSPEATAESTTESTTAETTDQDDGEPAPPAPGEEIVLVEGDPDVRIGTLDNGLTYYIRNNDNPGGSAELRLAVNAGSGREDTDQSGVAHFLEHMLFNGTEQFPKNELIEILRQSGSQFGADINAYTSYDETVYQLTVQTRDREPLETGLDVLAQWLSAATLDPDEVVRERGVVLDEWRRTEQASAGRVGDAIEGLFLTGSSYEGRDPIGTDDAISAMTPELLRRFYDEWYRPDNAAVVVVGNIDVDAVEQGIRERFESAVARADPGASDALTVGPFDEPGVAIHADPDITSSAVEVTVPLAANDPSSPTYRNAILDEVIFAMIANRLSADAARGEQPFDDAYVSDNNLVRAIDAPSIVVEAKTGRAGESMQPLLEEFERVRRFGFDEGEVARAVGETESAATADHESADSRQDRDFADGYAESFLTGGLISTADAGYDFVIATLRSLTPDVLDQRFLARWNASGPHVLMIAPEADAAGLPSDDDVLAAIAALPERELEPREASEDVPEELMTPPEPVDEIAAEELASHPQVYIDDPLQLAFDNGVRVIFNNTPIVDEQFIVYGRSPGGMAAVAADDVAEAKVAADIVTSSGVAEFDQAQLDQILSDSTATAGFYVTSSSDEIYASAASADMEEQFQLLHLYVSDPRVDDVAFDRALADAREVADNPSADPQSAGYNALLGLRYGDDPRFTPLVSSAELDSIDADSVARVFIERFGNASDWTFVIAGDYDRDLAIDLARTYLGTLSGTGSADPLVDIEPPPPPGIADETVQAGTGDRATLLRAYSSDVDDSVENVVLADLASELATNRLIVRIREELGESYSPNAYFGLTPSLDDGPGLLDVYVEISTAPDSVEHVSSILSEELADLATTGPTDDEIDSAESVVFEHYNLISNEALADALLGTATGIGTTVDTYVARYETIDALSPADVNAFLAAVIPLDRYVQVRVVPRS